MIYVFEFISVYCFLVCGRMGKDFVMIYIFYKMWLCNVVLFVLICVVFGVGVFLGFIVIVCGKNELMRNLYCSLDGDKVL